MLPLNFIAIIGAAVAAFVIGALWHTVLFSKLWLRLAGISEPTEAEKQEYAKHMWKPLLAGFANNLLMAFCLANIIHVTAVYFDAVGSVSNGLGVAFWTWLGFMATVTLTPVIWEKRSIQYWAFGAAYNFTIMLVMGAIIGWWV